MAGVILGEEGGPARLDGINPPENDERKWGLQTLLPKSFAEELSAKTLPRLGAELELRRSGSSLGPSL